ncbi:MAG: serine/threonine protein kinase, partial [Muribaculaceae bacterium]|nr:serine/threonine protein kinase [Muribaculaceae bacterium]
MQLREGSELQNGKYRILRVLGQGGFGITYLAENTLLDRKVAIKEFFPKDFCGRDNTSHLTLGTQNNAETVEKLKTRFLKEAKNIAKLDHTGIIKIHDIFEENNTAYYVMDYIEGENLNEIVKRQGPLSEAKAVQYIQKVGVALDYIHSRNMTHFDVKPANIMVRRSDDQPILIDFGLSKQYDSHGDATSTLMQGVSHGYSPIELYNPGSLSSFSPQTDVYSLGATLYFLLTGRVPPPASDLLENGIIMPPDFSDSNATAIQNAMSICRTKRPLQISAFTEQLSIQSNNQKPSQESVSDTNEDTVFINPEREKDKDINIQNTVTYEQIGDEEYEPSSWDRFVTNISSTNCLIDTYSVSNSRKLLYFFVHICLIILSIPLGWILWLVFFNRLKGALKKLFFVQNISDFDEGSDYSTVKCWGIISIPILVILIEGSFILYTVKDNHSRELNEYITEFNSKAPYYMMEAKITSIELRGKDIIYNCETSDNIHKEREVLNKQNVELWKPILTVEDSLFNLWNIKRYIFSFRNNGTPTGNVIFSKSELDDYKKIDENSKAS